MSEILSTVQELVKVGRVRVSAHGFEQLAEDDISFGKLLDSLPQARWIEEYQDYHKGPCVLVLQTTMAKQPVHVLWGVATNAANEATLIRAYRPESRAMDGGPVEKEAEMNRKSVRFVHADRYAAEVEIELIPDDGAWGPYLSKDDALKLDRVRGFLKRGDIAAASREARVFEMMPISA